MPAFLLAEVGVSVGVRPVGPFRVGGGGGRGHPAFPLAGVVVCVGGPFGTGGGGPPAFPLAGVGGRVGGPFGTGGGGPPAFPLAGVVVWVGGPFGTPKLPRMEFEDTWIW